MIVITAIQRAHLFKGLHHHIIVMHMYSPIRVSLLTVPLESCSLLLPEALFTYAHTRTVHNYNVLYPAVLIG